MASKNPAAVALGRKGGTANTPAQQNARRVNGKKGGRPRVSTELGRLCAILVANAELIEDPATEGATDIYAVPVDDVDAIRAYLFPNEKSKSD